MSIKFSKWTGLGNDFVLLEPGESLNFGDGFEQQVIKLCDRRFGIGADGVVLVTPLDGDGCTKGVDFEMRIASAEVKPDGAWHEYVVDLSRNWFWSGKINELWFEGVDLRHATVEIDWMRFEP